MKNLLVFAFVLFAFTVTSQTVIISEDFQDIDMWDIGNVIEDPDDTDDEWVSFDLDGIPTDNGNPGNWFLDFDLGYGNYDIGGPEPDPDSNLVMVSMSWLQNYDPNNENYLITPPIEVNAADYTVTWSTAPFQGPRYMDGYTVRVNTSGDNLAEDFNDIIFVGAEMEAFGPDSLVDNFPLDPASYVMTDGGYVHADGYTLTDYYTLDAGDENFAYGGILEPHTVSLAAYEGQTIYIAFVHDSSDDNLIMLDDVIVEGSVGIDDKPLSNMVSFFPNPFNNTLNMTFTNMITNGSIFEVYDLHGRLVLAETVFPEDNPSIQVDMTGLNSGLYSVRFIVDGVASQSHSIVKM